MNTIKQTESRLESRLQARLPAPQSSIAATKRRRNQDVVVQSSIAATKRGRNENVVVQRNHVICGAANPGCSRLFRRLHALPIMIATILALPAFGREEYTRNFDKTISVASGQRLRVIHRMGDIVIRTQPKGELVVHAVISASASSVSEAKQFADRIRIDVQPSGSAMLVETLYPKQEEGQSWLHNMSYSVRYEITMPENSPLEISNSFGAVRVTGLKANGEITTSHGKLEFRDGRGTQRLEDAFAAVEVTRNAGDLSVSDTNGSVTIGDVSGQVRVKDRFAKVTVARSGGTTVMSGNGAVDLSQIGGDVHVTTSFAPVSANSVKGNLSVNNQNGDVDAVGVTGFADLSTSFASVHFEDIGGAVTIKGQNSRVRGSKALGPATIQNSFAAVEVTDVRKGVRIVSQNSPVKATDVGEASVKTSFGGVVLAGVGGAVEVENQNGSIDVAMTRQQDCHPISMKTSFSSLRLRLPDNPSYALAAKTSFGKIHSDFPMMVSGALSTDALSGKIGAGACSLNLINQNGGIEILSSGSK